MRDDEGFYEPLFEGAPKEIIFETDPAQPVDLSLSPGQSSIRGPLEARGLGLPHSIQAIFFNYRSKLAQDWRFRKAIDCALDRERISAHVPFSRPKFNLIPSQFYGGQEKGAGQDLPQARRLIQELGIEGVVKVPLLREESPWHQEVRSQLAHAGLHIEYFQARVSVLDQPDPGLPFEWVAQISDVGHPSVLLGVLRPGGPYLASFDPPDHRWGALWSRIAQAKTPLERDHATLEMARYYNDWSYVILGGS